MDMETKLEFAVSMSCKSCSDAIHCVLDKEPGVRSVDIDVGKDSVIVNTSLPSQQILDKIESTGRPAVLMGMGSDKSKHLGAAVSQLSGSGSVGVLRVVQASQEDCIIDGTVDGLKPGRYMLSVNEYGDLSDGCNNCGDILHRGASVSESYQKYGYLGEVDADTAGRAQFKMKNNCIKVWDIIGRSMVLQGLDSVANTNADKNLNATPTKACGIIARSAGLFENAKRICPCDGLAIWDERKLPAAGDSRQQKAAQLS